MNSQLMNDFAQLLQKSTPQQREQLSSMLSNIVIKINHENVKKFAKKILKNENDKKNISNSSSNQLKSMV